MSGDAPGHLVGILVQGGLLKKLRKPGGAFNLCRNFRVREAGEPGQYGVQLLARPALLFHLGHIMGVDRSKGHPRNVPVMGFGGLHDKKTEGSAPYLNAFSPVMSMPVMSRWMSCVPS
jgi:hypothetical protein